MIDETEPYIPAACNKASTLTAEITAGSNPIDFDESTQFVEERMPLQIHRSRSNPANRLC